MCTLILAWRVFDGTPIAVAANRDEALGRPSRSPTRLDTDPDVIAPQDEAAGGTWIGYNDAGLFVAITNRRVDGVARSASNAKRGDGAGLDGERSRGLLVRDALARPSASEANAFVLNELADREYAGFNLVVADAREATLLEWDGVLRTTHFDPGVHVVVNEGHDEATAKVDRIRTEVSPVPTGNTDASSGLDDQSDVSSWFDRAKTALRDHDLDACIHGDGYGTRSSSLIAIDADGTARYWFADGKPCETDYAAVEIGDEDGQL